MDIYYIRDMLNNDSADRLSDQEVISFFKQPPIIKDKYFFENKLVIGVRGAGKTMILKCFYRYFFALMICEMTIKKPVSYFPVFLQLDNLVGYEPEEINKYITNEFVMGIRNTINVISNYSKNPDWIVQYIFSPLEQMRDFECFKDSVHQFYSGNTFQYINDFYNEIDKNGNIDKYIEKLRFFLNHIDSIIQQKNEKNSFLTPLELNKECSKFFCSEDKKIGKFYFFVDNMCDFNESYYNESGHFNALLESFRQCSCFNFYLSILKNSKAEAISKMSPLFSSAANIVLSYEITNERSFMDLRKFSCDVLIGVLGINSLDEIIDFDDTPFQEAKENSDGDAFEQLIYASMGLPRAMLKILKIALHNKDIKRFDLIEKNEIIEAIKIYADECLKIPDGYGEFAIQLEKLCKTVSTFYIFSDKFDERLMHCSFNRNNEPFLLPDDSYKSTSLKKYMLHYSYCVQSGIPTHIDKYGNIYANRSVVNGKWVTNNNLIVKYVKDKGYIQVESSI